MNVKHCFLVAGLLASPSLLAAPVSYTIDPAHTYPRFKISHLGFSTMHGQFNTTEGKLTIDQEKKTGSVEVKIDAKSVYTAFKKRDDHLRSPDFLNVAEFPDITYKSTSVKLSDKGGQVEGKLTIMGVSKSVPLKITAWKCGTHPMNKKQVCGFDATGKIKRSDFGVKFGLPAVGDDMELMIELEAVK